MDANNSQNQSYWFVLREDQNNVVFSSNNFTIQNPQEANAEPRYFETGDRQYIQIAEPVKLITEVDPDDASRNATKTLWDSEKIKLLLNVVAGNDTRDIVWNETSAIVGVSPEECIKKYRILRNTYIRLTKKKRLGKDIKWLHYNICDEAFKDCKLSPALLETWEDSKIKRMLSLYLDILNRFQNSDSAQRVVWKEIAKELGTTEYNCYHKFRVLKRTYWRCLERARESGKHVKWPYYSYYEKILCNQRPGPWDGNKIKLLLQAYTNIAYKFKSSKYNKKELWREIADAVGESPSNCDRKFRNLKQTFIKLKMRALKGSCTTKWTYFKDFQVIESVSPQEPPKPDHIQEQNYISKLLDFYVENKEKFRSSLKKKRHLWNQISSKLGLCPYECDRKFRNLKQTYLRLAKNIKLTGKTTNWPYYSYFEKIYDSPECKYRVSLDSAMREEIRRVVHEVQERKERDAKFEQLIQVSEESNRIQRDRNKILQALVDRMK